MCARGGAPNEYYKGKEENRGKKSGGGRMMKNQKNSSIFRIVMTSDCLIAKLPPGRNQDGRGSGIQFERDCNSTTAEG